MPDECIRLCNPMDCSPPGSSFHGILQAGGGRDRLDGPGHAGWRAWHLVSTFPVSADTIIARAYHPLREEESLKRQSHRASLCVFLRRKNQHCRWRIPNRALATPKFWRISRPVYFLVVYSKGRNTSSFTKTTALFSPSEQFIGNNN